MDFSSLDEFPFLSQVMSPNEHPAPPGLGAWDQPTRALVAEAGSHVKKRAQTENSTGPGPTQSSARALTPTPGPLQAGEPDKTAAMIRERLVLQPLDSGRPESYEFWRLAVKAEIVARGGGMDMVTEYVDAIENKEVTKEMLMRGVRGHQALRALDGALYSAILNAITGNRKETILCRMQAIVPFGAGGCALRYIDGEFQRGTRGAQVGATRELHTLTPEGQGAAAMDAFFAKYRMLLARAGEKSVSENSQIEILLRATQGHPALGAAVAAWRIEGSWGPNHLLEQLEDLVAEARGSHGGRGVSRAWVVAERDANEGNGEYSMGPTQNTATLQGQNPTAWPNWALTAAAQRYTNQATAGNPEDNKKCYRCGKIGHIRRNCNQNSTEAELLKAVRELTEMLKSKK